MKKIVLLLVLNIINICYTFAQSGGVEMATSLRSSGKIWVVVSVILTLIIGLFIFLFSIDKKVSKLEKGNK